MVSRRLRLHLPERIRFSLKLGVLGLERARLRSNVSSRRHILALKITLHTSCSAEMRACRLPSSTSTCRTDMSTVTAPDTTSRAERTAGRRFRARPASPSRTLRSTFPVDAFMIWRES
jgi:hypothetical protein